MRAPLLLLLLPLAGCHSYLIPFDERPLPAQAPLPTAGGTRIDLDDQGQLVLRPGAGDVESALGVALHPVEGGLLVTNRLRPDTALRPEDRIVHVLAAAPLGGEKVKKDHHYRLTLQAADVDPSSRLDTLSEIRKQTWFGRPGTIPTDPTLFAGLFDQFDPGAAAPDQELLERMLGPRALELLGPAQVAPIPAPDELRARSTAHEVRSAEDLRPYLVGLGWLELDLLVIRDGEELVIRQPLTEEPKWLPVRVWNAELTRWHGLDLVRVSDFPPERRPLHAAEDDLLVVRVARDAPAGRAGLRPLDLVPLASLPAVLGEPYTLEPRWVDANDGERRREFELTPRDAGAPVLVRAPSGAFKELTPPRKRETPTQFWFPLLISFQTDGVRTHLGLGPLDSWFHFSSRIDYEPSTDSYARTFRWASHGLITGAAVETPEGTRENAGLDLFFVFGAGADYVGEWLDARDQWENQWLDQLGPHTTRTGEASAEGHPEGGADGRGE